MTIDECAHIEEILSAMQDGAATPEERAQAERHISGCARCQATATAFGQIDRQVRRYLMATPVLGWVLWPITNAVTEILYRVVS